MLGHGAIRENAGQWGLGLGAGCWPLLWVRGAGGHMGWCKGGADRGGLRDSTLSPTRRRSAIHSTTPPPSAVLLDASDLHAFDPATMTWTLLSAALDAPRPSARNLHGFTSAGGKLYVHGGYGLLANGFNGDGCSLSLSLAHTPCARAHAVPPFVIRPRSY
jgi:hypothetical protein